MAILGAVTGVIIGGGHTPTYLSLYGTGPLGESLRNLSHGTTPIAGQSAGALIMPEVCAIPPEDTGADQVTIDVGLGLIENMVVGVHFTERDAQPHVLAAMAKTRTSRGLGIDEGACAIVRANQVRATVGTGVYEIEMQNFDKPDHTLRKLA